jgi:phenylacetate-coenzyme A ligase PaaK-like adenylate-forming protein
MTDELKARSLSPLDSHIRYIACTGGLITNRIRRLVDDEWKAQMLTSYSLTEFNGWAVGCSLTPNHYHFDPTMYAEVVDPASHREIKEGQEGILILTSLFPFQQAQPLIRYNTGDLVTHKGRQCDCGFVGSTIEFRGRFVHCVDLTDIVPRNSTRRYLASADIHDLLEDMPEVHSLIYPKFEVSRVNRSDGSAVLQITAEVNHIVDSDMETDLRERIRSSLNARYPDWKELFSQNRLAWDIRLVNRGDMSSFVKQASALRQAFEVSGC